MFLSGLSRGFCSVPCHHCFFRFARTVNGFRRNLREIGLIAATSRLKDYILGNIGTWRWKYSNRRQSVFRDVKQMPSE